MIIDIHAHPVLLDVINEASEDLSFRKQQFGVFKSGVLRLSGMEAGYGFLPRQGEPEEASGSEA